MATTSGGSVYGSGRNLFVPAEAEHFLGGPVTTSGARDWETRPSWHSNVYGQQAGGTSVVSAEAVVAYPVLHSEDGVGCKPPAHSNWGKAAVGAPQPRQRRTSTVLVRQAAQLKAQGLMPTVVADRLNVSDRRAKKLLSAASV